MGTLVTFPELRRSNPAMSTAQRGSATIIILPVIRIERHDDEPSDGYSAASAALRKRRRRATRS
jgi:hypothetical protein